MKRAQWILAALVAATACRNDRGEDEHSVGVTAARVHCEQASAATVHDVRTVRGTVAAAPDRDAVVSAQVPGRVRRVVVREGDTVRAGDLVAEVETQSIADALTQARAQLQQAQAGARNAGVFADRTEHLFARGIAARQESDDAAARREQANAAVTAARAGVDLAARNLERAGVRAPIAGSVLHVIRHAGELVDGTSGTPLLEIADPSSLELLVHAAPADLIELHAGQLADVQFDALPGRTFHGSVRVVAPAIDVATGMGAVRLALDAAESRPPFGLLGVARISVGEHSAPVVVPSGALRNAGAETQVIVCDHSHARVQPVEVGTRESNHVEITSGLHPGDRVVVDAVLALENGVVLNEQD